MKDECMQSIEMKKNIYWIGVNDRTTDLFEGLWPISSEGVSYNAYLINDKKKAIVDLSKAFKTDVFFDRISEICDLSEIDYVIINHMEPDHTGVLRNLRRMSPEMTIVCTEKAKGMLKDYYRLEENIKVVADGESLELGEHTLTFFHAPFVHWPETMVTYENTEKVLFSCDAFGGYGALQGALFDDQCHDIDFYKKESLRYFANIVAKFTRPVLSAIKKLGALSIDTIAPSHGLVWREHPETIINLYEQWSNYPTGGCKKEVTLLYGSMYGNTEAMMNAIAQGLSDENVFVEIFDVARTHSSYILPSLWEKEGVLIGAPTYEVSLFPPMVHLLEEAAIKRVINKKAAYFGSYGWSGGAIKKIKQIIEPIKWSFEDVLDFRGEPNKDMLAKGKTFGRDFARKLKNS